MKLKMLFVLGFAMCINYSSIAQNSWEKKGVLYQLTILKYSVELKLVESLNDTTAGHDAFIRKCEILKEELSKQKGKSKKLLLKIYEDSSQKFKEEYEQAESIRTKNIIRQYLRLKMELDAAINQFLFEMNNKNSLRRKFNKINEHFISGEESYGCSNRNVDTFALELKKYKKDCIEFIRPENNPKNYMVEVPAPLDVVSFAQTVFKDMKDLQAKKIENLSAFLNGVKLSNPKELTSSDK